MGEDEHLGQFGGRPASNLLHAQSQEIVLELS